jgi:hypothetical protein
VVIIVTVAMSLLGLFGRFTGNGTDIADIKSEIAQMKDAKVASDALTATNTLAIAAVTAASASQGRDIVDIKGSLVSLKFIDCALYTKVYAGAPPPSECLKSDANP